VLTPPSLTPAASLYASSIVDTLRGPLLLLDEHLRVVLANRSFRQMFEGDFGQCENRFLYDVGHGEWNIPALRQLLEDVLSDGSEPRDLEVEQRFQQAERRTIRLNARRLHHPGEQVRLILLAIEDVSERRGLERTLQRTMAELERSNRELDSFASVASHDLQEPLRKIRAFGERLEAAAEGRLPEKARDYLARMVAASSRMQKLITDLLTLARVTKGEAWQKVDLASVVADVLIDLEEAIGRTAGRVDVGALPVIEGDPVQMRQLFQNLIGNALKFHGASAPIVEISANESAPLLPSGLVSHHPVWRIVVADNGIGFQQKYAERIFNPFERLHPRAAFDGTGIGLALCRRIVSRHGGAISAEGEPGRGARFIVLLPAVQKDSS
jgi:signal transduction histidine kinase